MKINIWIFYKYINMFSLILFTFLELKTFIVISV